MTADILGFRQYRKGIVKNVDTHIAMDELMEEIKSTVEVAQVERLKMKKRNSSSTNEDKLIPSTTILITFVGQMLPEQVKICYAKHQVTPYINRSMQFYGCCSFGHTKKIANKKKSVSTVVKQ